MKLRNLLTREIRYRRLNFALSVVSVAFGVAAVVSSALLLRAFDRATEDTLAQMAEVSRGAWDRYQDEMRKDMLEMGFNLMILHKDHNLSSPPDEARFVPESYIERLAASRVATINHILPFLQQKVWWPERKRWIALVGTPGEIFVQNAAKQKPMQARVKKNHAILGYAVHQGLGLKAGETMTLLGREFRVQECQPARSFEEDEQVWIPLDEAQDLLGKKGLLTGLLAINCQCEPKDLFKIHDEIAALLPDTRVVEHSSRLLTRAKVRAKAAQEADEALARETETRRDLREKRAGFSALWIPTLVAVSALWLGVLTWINAHHRRFEIGILGAMGVPSRGVLWLFMAKAAIVGVAGAVLGVCAGIGLAAAYAGIAAAKPAGSDVLLFGAYVLAAAVMSLAASWIPALAAAQRDPAAVLREE